MKAAMYNTNSWITETEPPILKTIFDELLKKSGFSVISFQEHYFEPQGYTALWLLSESHFAIHTFPEEEQTYIELSSCNEDYFLYFIDKLPNIITNV